MILGLFGTNPYSFIRLAKALDNLGKEYEGKVIVQSGSTKYAFKHCESKDFFSHEELTALILKSKVVVCHGGFGSISEALLLGRPVLAVPRYPRHGECQDHQDDIVRSFAKRGIITACYEGLYELPKIALRLAANKQTHLMPNDTSQEVSLPLIKDIVEEFIQSTQTQRIT